MTNEELIELGEPTDLSKLSKTELLTKMRTLQAEYSKYASFLKIITNEEDMRDREHRQLARLEEYRNKYKFYVQDDGSAKLIDWEDVEKLVRQSIPTGEGYMLGYEQSGMEGLGYFHQSGFTKFTPMVETEEDVRKYVERETRKKEFEARVRRK